MNLKTEKKLNEKYIYKFFNLLSTFNDIKKVY